MRVEFTTEKHNIDITSLIAIHLAGGIEASADNLAPFVDCCKIRERHRQNLNHPDPKSWIIDDGIGKGHSQYHSMGTVMSKDTESVDEVVVQKLENALSAKIEAYFAEALDESPDVLEELLKSKNSDGTRRAYRRDITDFFVRMTKERPNRDSILEFLHLEGHKATLIVTKYRAKLNEDGLSPNTINRRLAAIKSLVGYGRKLGVCSYAVDVDSVPTQAYRDTSGCTGEEFLTVIKGCDR